MSGTIFRSSDPPVKPPSAPEPEREEHGMEIPIEDVEPIEEREKRTGDILLEVLDINEDVNNLPEEDQKNLKETKEHILDLVEAKGLKRNFESFKETFEELIEEVGLTKNAEPSVILDRIGGVIRAWKSLSFIKDPKEKRRLFMKLARMETSKDMNKLIFQEQESRKIWQ